MAMTDKADEMPGRSEIELLLPWYVTGKLGAVDRGRVEAFLATHPEMQRQIELVREEKEQSVRANEALGHPSPESINRATASLGRQRRALLLVDAWERIVAFFAAPTPGGVRWTAAIAAVLLLLQTAVIGVLVLSRSSEFYGTASGPQSTARGATLLVSFADHATAASIAALLSEFDAQIIEGPKPGGIYRIRLASPPATEAGRHEIVRRLRLRED